MLKKPLSYRQGAEVGPAYGAARLAKLGTSTLSPSDVCLAGAIIHVIDPDQTMSSYYSKQHKKYQKHYQNLTECF